jgi:uncharacterized protein DUF6602
MSLEVMIRSIEDQMLLKLEAVRKTFVHAGDKGSAVEAVMREFLVQYLPSRMRVGQGEVIDTLGSRSTQTDIVIADEDHPAIFTKDQPGLFFVEGVVGAGEVKSILTSDGLAKSLVNSRQFKQLRNCHLPGDAIVGLGDPAQDPFRLCPPYFLVAFESQLSLASIHERALAADTEANQQSESVLDAIFVLGTGCVMNLRDGTGRVKAFDAIGVPLSGWHWQDSDRTLFDLLVWISSVRNRILRMQSIISRYRLPRS